MTKTKTKTKTKTYSTLKPFNLLTFKTLNSQ